MNIRRIGIPLLTLNFFLSPYFRKIIGLEVQPILSLSLELPPGTKVKLRAICTPMRRGVALLSRECLVLLEGSVERLTQSGPVAPTVTKTIMQEKTLPPPVKLTNSLQQQPHASLSPRLQNEQMQMQPNRTAPIVGQILSSVMPLDTPISFNQIGDNSTPFVLSPYHPKEKSFSADHGDSYDLRDTKDEGVVPYMRHLHQQQNRGEGKRRSPHITHGATLTSFKIDKDDSNVLDLCSPPPTPPILKPSSSIFMSAPIQCCDELSSSNPNLSTLMVSPNIPSVLKSTIASRANSNAPIASILCSPSPSSLGNNPGISSSETALRFVPMDSISIAESASVSTERMMRVPHGEFLVRGIAVNIRKFKVTATEGYVVLLSLEEDEPDSGRDPERVKVVLPVTVSSDLCAKYLQLTVKEYLSQHEKLKKDASKALKIACSLRFRDFKGIFRVKSQQKSPSGPTSHPNVGCTNASSQSTETTSLLLLDFHCLET